MLQLFDLHAEYDNLLEIKFQKLDSKSIQIMNKNTLR